MKTNPYEHNKQIPWRPQQNSWYDPAGTNQHSPVPENRGMSQKGMVKPKAPKPMPKARTLALAHTLKTWLVVASLVGFVSLSGLVASHQVTSASAQTPSKPSLATPAPSQVNSVTPTPSPDSSGFFNQPGGNNFGSSNPSQAPVSGSSVS